MREQVLQKVQCEPRIFCGPSGRHGLTIDGLIIVSWMGLTGFSLDILMKHWRGSFIGQTAQRQPTDTRERPTIQEAVVKTVLQLTLLVVSEAT
jgi:hypothetical protein